MKRLIKWLVFKCIYPVCYSLSALRPVKKKKILFVENHQDTLSDNYTLLYEKYEKSGYDCRVHYLQVANSSWGKIIPRSIKLLWDMGNAAVTYVSESNSLFGAFSIRKKSKLIQVWHACGAFKRWGFSVADKSFGEDMKELSRYEGHGNYTLVPVSGKAVCWAYEEAFGISPDAKVVRPLGVSRTDWYFQPKQKQLAQKKLERLPISIGERKVLLYAPTFRGEIKNAKSPDFFDVKQFASLKEEYVVLMKQHPFVKEDVFIPEACRDFCMEIRDELSTPELLAVADVCVTDYSSVVFEYALLERPIYFLAPDLEDYYDERGFYYPYKEFVPGPIVKDTKELIGYINNIDSFDRERLQTFKDTYMNGCDGHATERIMEFASV